MNTVTAIALRGGAKDEFRPESVTLTEMADGYVTVDATWDPEDQAFSDVEVLHLVM